MPTYEHRCESCQHEWEDFYSIKADPPKTCPQCHQETVKRLISCSSKGVVELTGKELIEKLQGDGEVMKKEIYRSENAYANFIGEDRYQNIQTQMDRRPKPERRLFTRKS